jgi:hypothetical protein
LSTKSAIYHAAKPDAPAIKQGFEALLEPGQVVNYARWVSPRPIFGVRIRSVGILITSTGFLGVLQAMLGDYVMQAIPELPIVRGNEQHTKKAGGDGRMHWLGIGLIVGVKGDGG